MEDKRNPNGELSLTQVVELVGLPARLELVREGLDLPADLYRKLVRRVADHYFGVVGLGLRETRPEHYALDLRGGSEWRDVAYALAHVANVKQDRVVYHDEEELLHRGPEGEPRDFHDFKDAVWANLDLLRADPSEREVQQRAFRAAAEASLEVIKARRAA
ncbi:MAG: hypothetical protein LDL11_03315 [Desulfarculus sp.]|nr:hypothetical protein [Desulfarculus sp.]